MRSLNEMPSHRKGDYTEAVVVAELKRREVPVSTPFGDNERYDLVLEYDDGFVCAQVKTGRLTDGKVLFHGKSGHTNSQGNVYKKYDGDVDLFLVYCHELETLYLVHEDAFDSSIHLRVEEPKQHQRTIHWAEDYEFDRNWPPEDAGSDPAREDGRRVIESLRERGVTVVQPATDRPYDVLLETPDGGFLRTTILPGWLVDGRVRFDCGGSTAPGPEDTDLVVVHCAELEETYLARREEYDVTISLRIDPPKKRQPSINWAEEYEFDRRWPPGPREGE